MIGLLLSARVGRRGQIVLPRQVRRRLHVQEGDQVAFIIDDGKVIIKPISHSLLALRGSVEVKGEQDFDVIRKQVAAQRPRRENEQGRVRGP